MKILVRSIPVVLVAAAVYGLVPGPADGPRALIVIDYADDGTNLATTTEAMEARNWIVESVHYSGLMVEAENIGTNWDVVWVLPGAEYEMLRDISNEVLAGFIQDGGVLILPGVSTEFSLIDVAPGGVDVFREENTGVTNIDAPGHPLIAAAASGGVDLTAADLDPDGTGGDGCMDPETPGIFCECLAANAAGPVLAVYDLGAGHVVLSVFDMLNDACMGNLLIYTESVVSGQ